ncbi:MAG: sigma-70 family RNA polymerase sigma factor [Clostridia bacterium]|nr:sigma-70 family RNA polymerase sigma factor [Clostridia bacterium]
MMEQNEANELFRQYRRTHDVNIRNRLVENYLNIAEILAKKFSGRGVEYDDLYQVASEALIAGVEKFDPDLGNQFTTYITPTITGMIKNYFRDYSRSVRLPRRVYTVSARVREEANEYYKLNGVKPTVSWLAEKTGYSEELIIEALECRTPVSLDTRVKGDDGEKDAPLYDVIASDTDTFESFEDAEALKAEIAKLEPTERQVITLRYVQGKSQAEVGKILGVSQMFVSRAERKIVEKLKEALTL